MLDKAGKVLYIEYLLFLYHFSCLVSISQFTALILDFENGGRPPSCIFIISRYLSKIQICAYFYVDTQNLVKIGQSVVELLCIFDFQNGVSPPYWIWYDVIADNPQLVFDGPNIFVKLHVDRVYTLQDITIFIFGPFGLNLPIHTPFWGPASVAQWAEAQCAPAGTVCRRGGVQSPGRPADFVFGFQGRML